jgi:tRNA/tmRNA/rRNA uracil-C5-methylase (TrmA/RlmC/RlmD family)
VAVGPVAHGGHCVARHEGRVVFVRHALPGERVVARVTEDTGGSYCRADAVRVLVGSPDRVRPPCRYAGPGGCGGCDWQHAAPAAQRRLKAAVVAEALARLAGLSDVDVTVEELPGGPLGWRTRLQLAVGADGRPGLRRHRSHEVQPLDHCLLATDEVGAAGVLARRWPGMATVEVAAAGGEVCTLATPRDRADQPAQPPRQPARQAARQVARPAARPAARQAAQPVAQSAAGQAARPRRTGPARLTEQAAGRSWQVSAGGFWQVHPAAASALAGCIIDLLRPAAGETALDLYAGAGLFAGVLAAAVGMTGRVLAVEADPVAVRDAERNLAGQPQASVRRGRVTPALLAGLGLAPDLVVLDPPRAGAGRQVTEAVCALRPRAVAYVGCDPATLARDLRTAAAHGYPLAALHAFDLFPMTHHVECVALLEPAG